MSTTKNSTKPHSSKQLEFPFERSVEGDDEIMVDLRDACGAMPELIISADFASMKEWADEDFYIRCTLKRHFDDNSPELAYQRTFEEFVEAWKGLSDRYWCLEDRLKSTCDACGRLLDNQNLTVLSDGTTVHFGGEWGAGCLTYTRLVSERERDEAIAAIERLGIGSQELFG